VISHNHYDHLDRNTFREVYTKYASRPPALFIGLNGGPAVSDIVPKEASLAALDWWEDRELNVPGRGRARITASAWCSSSRDMGCKADGSSSESTFVCERTVRYGQVTLGELDGPECHRVWRSWRFRTFPSASSLSHGLLNIIRQVWFAGDTGETPTSVLRHNVLT